MKTVLGDDNQVGSDFIDQSVFIIDPSRPKSREFGLEGFRFAKSLKRMAQDVIDQLIDFVCLHAFAKKFNQPTLFAQIDRSCIGIPINQFTALDFLHSFTQARRIGGIADLKVMAFIFGLQKFMPELSSALHAEARPLSPHAGFASLVFAVN